MSSNHRLGRTDTTKGPQMKILLAACIAASLVAGLADQASAATYGRKHMRSSGHVHGAYEYRIYARDPNARPTWSPHDLRLLPFGSKLWWEQREREFGGGHR